MLDGKQIWIDSILIRFGVKLCKLHSSLIGPMGIVQDQVEMITMEMITMVMITIVMIDHHEGYHQVQDEDEVLNDDDAKNGDHDIRNQN